MNPLRAFSFPSAVSALEAATRDRLIEQLEWKELKQLAELFDSIEVAPDEKGEYDLYASKLREVLDKRVPPDMPFLRWPTDPNLLRMKTGEFNMHPLVFPALLEAHGGVFTESSLAARFLHVALQPDSSAWGGQEEIVAFARMAEVRVLVYTENGKEVRRQQLASGPGEVDEWFTLRLLRDEAGAHWDLLLPAAVQPSWPEVLVLEDGAFNVIRVVRDHNCLFCCLAQFFNRCCLPLAQKEKHMRWLKRTPGEIWGHDFVVSTDRRDRLLDLATGIVFAIGTAITDKESAFALLILGFVQEQTAWKFLVWDGCAVTVKSIYGVLPSRESSVRSPWLQCNPPLALLNSDWQSALSEFKQGKAQSLVVSAPAQPLPAKPPTAVLPITQTEASLPMGRKSTRLSCLAEKKRNACFDSGNSSKETHGSSGHKAKKQRTSGHTQHHTRALAHGGARAGGGKSKKPDGRAGADKANRKRGPPRKLQKPVTKRRALSALVVSDDEKPSEPTNLAPKPAEPANLALPKPADAAPKPDGGMYIDAATALKMGEELGGLKAEVEMRKQWKDELVKVLNSQVDVLNARLDNATGGLRAPRHVAPRLVLSVEDVQNWILSDQERKQLHTLAPSFLTLEIRGQDLLDPSRIYASRSRESSCVDDSTPKTPV